MKNNLTGLQHIGIPTNDLDSTVAFYEHLGFEVALKVLNEEANERVAFLKLGDFVIESYENHQAALCDGAINHIAINVKSIEEAYEWIMQQGLNNTQDDIHFLPFWEKGVKFFTIEGPNKERIEFSQYL